MTAEKSLDQYHLIEWGGVEMGKRPRTKIAIQRGHHALILRHDPWEAPINGPRSTYQPRHIQNVKILHSWPQGQVPTRADVSAVRLQIPKHPSHEV